jgi:hypothetical protein
MYFLTLKLRDPLPLWREADPEDQPAHYEQAVAVMERLTRSLSRLVEEIRKEHGPMQYLAVVELTTGRRTPGHRPHLHVLVRGPAGACAKSFAKLFSGPGSIQIRPDRLRRTWTPDQTSIASFGLLMPRSNSSLRCSLPFRANSLSSS